MSACRRPCVECPWKTETKPGQFPPERYEALRSTTGSPGLEAPYGSSMFGCHKAAEGEDFYCAGWLAAVGIESLTVRVLVSQGRIPADALKPGADWPELYPSYAALLRVHGNPRPQVVLIGCVAGKRTTPMAARELYDSTLFTKRRAYAEASGWPWAILSAFHGLVLPDAIIGPYNRVLTPPLIPDWASRVRTGLLAWLGDELAGSTLEVHAGVHYVDGVERAAAWLGRFGAGAPVVDAPLRGLGIGKQLAWYGRENDF